MRAAPEDLVRGLVLRDDRGGNTAALADLVTALLCPCPNFRAALAARTAARATPAAACATRSTASVFNILAELLAQILGMRGAHIDLIAGTVKGERNRLCSSVSPSWGRSHTTVTTVFCAMGGQPFCW